MSDVEKYRKTIYLAAVFAAAACFGASPALAQGGSASGGGGGSGGGGDHSSAGTAGESEESATGPFYVKLGALLAPIAEKRRIKGYAEVVVTLEIADREGEGLVRDKAVVLRDRFLRDLQFQAGMRSEGDPAISLKRIKARFKMLAGRVVGEGVVTEVLIESAIYHGV